MKLRVVMRWTAGFLLIALGLARGIGGLALMFYGSGMLPASRAGREGSALLGIGLLVVAYLALWAGLAVLLRRIYATRLALVALGVFLAGGLLNGFVLYGAPRPAGVAANLAVAVVIAVAAVTAGRPNGRN